MSYETILYDTDGATATITLNRPHRLNSMVPQMLDDLDAAVREANRDPAVKVVILRGAGRAFSAGFDFGQDFSTGYGTILYTDGKWDPGKDMIGTTDGLTAPVPRFMGIWRCPKPVIAQVHGWCVGGGSDLALCADLVIASEDAQIVTPYSRMWGCYLTGMWIYRLSLARCKWHALTGEPLSGKEAAEIELINRAVSFEKLETTVRELAEKLAGLPASQLAAMKLIVNQAYENMGLASTQLLGPVLDGYMRNTPEALRFVDVAAEKGVAAAVEERDGPFRDYSQATAKRKPNPRNVIVPR